MHLGERAHGVPALRGAVPHLPPHRGRVRSLGVLAGPPRSLVAVVAPPSRGRGAGRRAPRGPSSPRWPTGRRDRAARRRLRAAVPALPPRPDRSPRAFRGRRLRRAVRPARAPGSAPQPALRGRVRLRSSEEGGNPDAQRTRVPTSGSSAAMGSVARVVESWPATPARHGSSSSSLRWRRSRS